MTEEKYEGDVDADSGECDLPAAEVGRLVGAARAGRGRALIVVVSANWRGQRQVEVGVGESVGAEVVAHG